MAKVFGVEVKAVRNIVDHEGCLIHAGNIYLDGKKIGSWADDYMAGPAQFDVPDNEYKMLVDRANKFYEIYKWENGGKQQDATIFKGNPDILIGVLIQLKEQEAEFKRCLKAHPAYKSMIVVSGPYGQYSYWYIPGIHDDWETKYQAQIEQSKNTFPKWSNPKAKYIKGFESFDVNEHTKEFTW